MTVYYLMRHKGETRNWFSSVFCVCHPLFTQVSGFYGLAVLLGL